MTHNVSLGYYVILLKMRFAVKLFFFSCSYFFAFTWAHNSEQFRKWPCGSHPVEKWRKWRKCKKMSFAPKIHSVSSWSVSGMCWEFHVLATQARRRFQMCDPGKKLPYHMMSEKSSSGEILTQGVFSAQFYGEGRLAQEVDSGCKWLAASLRV